MTDTHEDAGTGEVVFIEEAASIADAAVSTLRKWRLHGEGPPSYRRGSRVVYLRHEVEEWVARERALVPNGKALETSGGPRP